MQQNEQPKNEQPKNEQVTKTRQEPELSTFILIESYTGPTTSNLIP